MMNKTAIKRLTALMLMLMMACSMAFAETAEVEETVIPGNVPERGLILPMTEADVNELRLNTGFSIVATPEVSEVPFFNITYTDEEGMEKAMKSYTEEELNDEEKFWDILMEIFSHNYSIYNIVLFEKDYYDAKIAEGKTAEDIIGSDMEIPVIGENDGYVYLGIPQYEELLEAMETDTQKAKAEKVVARCKELIANLTFQPIVFAPGEFTEVPDDAIVFSTKDINGNDVTNELFHGKKLTVLNVWGTFCEPCISEMPELAAWSQSMPEGVQLVGLVSDVNSYDNVDGVETARMICDATGASVYTHLIANEDFAELLSGVVGVPTTLFIDGNGAFVANPVVGVNVAACKAIVEDFLAE